MLVFSRMTATKVAVIFFRELVGVWGIYSWAVSFAEVDITSTPQSPTRPPQPCEGGPIYS